MPQTVNQAVRLSFPQKISRLGERMHDGAILLGGIVGFIVVLGVGLLEWLRIGDPGPLAPDNSAPLKGLFYGGGLTLLKAQFIGSAIITVSTFAVAMLGMWLVNLTGTLRVSREGELYGIDLHEHGISAYPEYVITALGSPSGMDR
jgi:Amt family ammonium transporter